MKTNQLLVIALLGSILILGFSSCGVFRKSSSKIIKEQHGRRITKKMPCTENEKSTKEQFRSVANAVSWDLQTAKNQARLDAEVQLAGSLHSFVSQVYSNYENNLTQNAQSENTKLFEGLSYRVVQQHLHGIETNCYEVYILSDGRYRVYIGLQLPNNILSVINDYVSSDVERSTKFNRELFQDVYNEQLEKYIKSQIQ